jgi:hypothetical protein
VEAARLITLNVNKTVLDLDRVRLYVRTCGSGHQLSCRDVKARLVQRTFDAIAIDESI